MTTSGRSASMMGKAARAVAASPTTSQSGTPASTCFSPFRNKAWSSTMTIFIELLERAASAPSMPTKYGGD